MDNQEKNENLLKTRSSRTRISKDNASPTKSKRSYRRKISAVSSEENASSPVMKKKSGRKYNQSSLNKEDKKSAEGSSESNLSVTEIKTRRGRKKVQEEFTLVDISNDEGLNPEVFPEIKKRKRKSSLNRKNIKSASNSKNDSQISKIGTRRGKRKLQEKYTLVDISHDEPSETIVETKNDKESLKDNQQKETLNDSGKTESSYLKAKTVKGRKRKIAANKSIGDQSFNDNYEKSVLQEVESASGLSQSKNSKVKITKGRKKVKATSTSEEDLQKNDNKGLKNAKTAKNNQKEDVLTPRKATRNARRKATGIVNCVENEDPKIAEMGSNKENAEDTEDVISENVKNKKTLVRPKRKKAEVCSTENIEFDKRTYKESGNKRRKATEKSVTLGENLEDNENIISEIIPQTKKGRRKRVITTEQEVASKQENMEKKNRKKRKLNEIPAAVNQTEELEENLLLNENETLGVSGDEGKKKKKMQRTPKKSKRNHDPTKESNKTKVSPVQRVTRSLRPRK